MPRKEEVLFCKIAISNGLITQEQAQKVLGLCDKREEESGRRPMIGAVFTKYNLMQTPEVQKIYGAVEKRLGTSMAPKVASAKGKGRGAKGAVRGGRGGTPERGAKPARAVDPQTLWMGIGGLVLFFGIVVALVIMVMMPSAAEKAKAEEDAKIAGEATGGATSGGTAKTAAGVTPGGSSAPAAAGGGNKRDLPADLQSQVNAIIMDARSESGNPTMGLASLKRMESQLRAQAYEAPQKLLDAIKEFEELVKAEGAGEGPAPAEETAPTKADAPAETAKAAPDSKPTEKKAEAEAPKAEAPKAADETTSNDDELNSILEGQ